MRHNALLAADGSVRADRETVACARTRGQFVGCARQRRLWADRSALARDRRGAHAKPGPREMARSAVPGPRDGQGALPREFDRPLAAQGKADDAISLAEANRGPWTSGTDVTRDEDASSHPRTMAMLLVQELDYASVADHVAEEHPGTARLRFQVTCRLRSIPTPVLWSRVSSESRLVLISAAVSRKP